MSFSTIFGFIMGRNSDVSGRCEERRARLNEELDIALQRHYTVAELSEHVSTALATEFAMKRLERERLVHAKS